MRAEVTRRVAERPRERQLRQRLPAPRVQSRSRARIFARISSEIRSWESELGRLAREPAGSRRGSGSSECPVRAARRRCSPRRAPRGRRAGPARSSGSASSRRAGGSEGAFRASGESPQPRGCAPASRRRPRVESLPRADRRVERAHRLLEWRLRVKAVRVEEVDVVEAHSGKALVEAREQVLARAPVAVRAGPHVVAGFGPDHELVAVRGGDPR